MKARLSPRPLQNRNRLGYEWGHAEHQSYPSLFRFWSGRGDSRAFIADDRYVRLPLVHHPYERRAQVGIELETLALIEVAERFLERPCFAVRPAGAERRMNAPDVAPPS